MISKHFVNFIAMMILAVAYSIATDVTYLHFPSNVNPLPNNVREITQSDAPEAVKRLNNMAHQLEKQGQYKDAYKTYEEALHILQDAEAPVKEVVVVLNEIATIQREMGDIIGSLNTLVEILELQESDYVDGPQYEKHHTMMNIAMTMMFGNYFHDALPFLNELVHTFTAEYGTSPHTAESLDFLGEAYLQLGLTDEAINIWSDSMYMWDDLDRPSRKADTMNSIGVAYFQSGDFVNAQSIFEDTIMTYMKSETEDNQHLALAKSNLEMVLRAFQTEGVTVVEECIANYHLNGRFNKTGSTEC